MNHMVERQRDIMLLSGQIDFLGKNIDRIIVKVNKKMNIDDFESKVYNKANRSYVDNL